MDLRKVVFAPDLFEVWDGGHCYIRVSRNVLSKDRLEKETIKISRWPERTNIQDQRDLAEWLLGRGDWNEGSPQNFLTLAVHFLCQASQAAGPRGEAINAIIGQIKGLQMDGLTDRRSEDRREPKEDRREPKSERRK